MNSLLSKVISSSTRANVFPSLTPRIQYTSLGSRSSLPLPLLRAPLYHRFSQSLFSPIPHATITTAPLGLAATHTLARHFGTASPPPTTPPTKPEWSDPDQYYDWKESRSPLATRLPYWLVFCTYAFILGLICFAPRKIPKFDLPEPEGDEYNMVDEGDVDLEENEDEDEELLDELEYEERQHLETKFKSRKLHMEYIWRLLVANVYRAIEKDPFIMKIVNAPMFPLRKDAQFIMFQNDSFSMILPTHRITPPFDKIGNVYLDMVKDGYFYRPQNLYIQFEDGRLRVIPHNDEFDIDSRKKKYQTRVIARRIRREFLDKNRQFQEKVEGRPIEKIKRLTVIERFDEMIFPYGL